MTVQGSRHLILPISRTHSLGVFEGHDVARQRGISISSTRRLDQATIQDLFPASINELERTGTAINFNTICTAARVSKTFLYDPKHSDLAQQIRSLRQVTPQSTATLPARSNKSDSARDAQMARFKERVRTLEEQVPIAQRRE
jgi:hypothetical protein